MADQTIEIKLMLRDEMSRQLAPITAELQKLSNLRLDRSIGGMERFGGATRLVRRELSSLAHLTFGGIIGGGVVASLVGVTKALGDMAQEGLRLRYTADALGVKHEWLQSLTDGLSALGVSSQEAEGSLKSALGALRDAETFGTDSNLFKTLEKGVRGSGIRLWNELRSVMAGPEGAQGALQHLFRRMKTMDPTGQRELLKSLNLSSLAVADLERILPQLHKRIQLTRPELEKLNVANQNFKIEMGNIGTILGSALMPAITKVTTALADFLKTEAGKKFAAELRTWADSVASSISSWILDKGPNGLEANIEQFKKDVAQLKVEFEGADKVIKGLGGWTPILAGLVATGFLVWLTGIARTLTVIGPLLLALRDVMQTLGKSPEQLQQEMDDLKKDPEGAYQLLKQEGMIGALLKLLDEWIKSKIPQDEQPKPQSGEGKPQTDPERRAAVQEDERERDALNQELKQLAVGTGHLADYLGQGAIGGPEGKADGGSGFGAGVSGMGQGVDAGVGAWPAMAATQPLGGIQLAGMGSLAGLVGGGGGPSADWRNTPLPGGSFSQRARMERRGEFRSMMAGADFSELEPSQPGSAEWENAPAPPNYGSGGNLPRPGDIGSMIRSKRGLNAGRQPDWDVAPYWKQQEFYPRGASFSGGGGDGFSEAGMAGLTQTMAQRDGSGSVNGSATIDIDVGGLGQPARNPADLFRPQSLDGAVQMQNATQPQHNPLSFQ